MSVVLWLDGCLDQFYSLAGSLSIARRFFYFVQNINSVHHLTEDGVLAVEVGRPPEYYEKRGISGIRIIAPRHR